eukprot:9024671-Lingulodinium_polyedra.AAC.1
MPQSLHDRPPRAIPQTSDLSSRSRARYPVRRQRRAAKRSCARRRCCCAIPGQPWMFCPVV